MTTLRIGVVLGAVCAIAAVDSAAQVTTCFPNAFGVPAASGPPQWWTSPPDKPFAYRIDDPRWVGAVQHTYGSGTAEQVRFRGLKYASGGVTSLYLSFHVRVDPSLDDSQDVLFVGFTQPGGGNPVIIKVTTYTASAADITAGAPGGVSVLEFDGATWNPVATPAWLNDTKAWLVATAPYSWAVHLRVPISAGGLASGLNLTDPFKIWFEADVTTPGGLVQYAWPRGTPTFPDPVTGDMAFPDPTAWGDAYVSSNPACAGVSIAWGDVGTNNPVSSQILFTAPPAANTVTNTLYARPTNGTAAIIPGGKILARFYVANWGTLPDWNSVTNPVTLWTEVMPGSLPANSAGIPPGLTADGTNDIQLSWMLSDCERYDYIADPYPAACTGREKRRFHQCMLVELSDTTSPGLTFTNSSVYRNMDFVTASRFERRADVSVRGLPDFPGSPTRPVYLYVEQRNLPRRVAAGAPADSGQAKDTVLRPESLQTPTGGGRQPRTLPPPPPDTLADWPTYRVHAYHDAGDSIRIGGAWVRRLKPQSSFGYYVSHDGALLGWKTALVGAAEIAPNFYRVGVPNNGAVTIRTRIRALERGWELIPWWVWLVLVLLALLIIAIAFRQRGSAP